MDRSSPSSAKDDLGAKAAEYVRLPSLSAYLVLAQDEPKVWVWVRGAAGFSPAPIPITGLDVTVAIAVFGIDLPLTEIYSGIEAT